MQRILIVNFFWSTKNNVSDFSQKFKKELLILLFINPLFLGNQKVWRALY